MKDVVQSEFFFVVVVAFLSLSFYYFPFTSLTLTQREVASLPLKGDSSLRLEQITLSKAGIPYLATSDTGQVIRYGVATPSIQPSHETIKKMALMLKFQYRNISFNFKILGKFTFSVATLSPVVCGASRVTNCETRF